MSGRFLWVKEHQPIRFTGCSDFGWDPWCRYQCLCILMIGLSIMHDWLALLLLPVWSETQYPANIKDGGYFFGHLHLRLSAGTRLNYQHRAISYLHLLHKPQLHRRWYTYQGWHYLLLCIFTVIWCLQARYWVSSQRIHKEVELSPKPQRLATL